MLPRRLVPDRGILLEIHVLKGVTKKYSIPGRGILIAIMALQRSLVIGRGSLLRFRSYKEV